MSYSRKVEKEKTEIKKVIHASIGWALAKDKGMLFRSMAQEEDFFIFHPDSASTIVGFENFRTHVENVFMNEGFKALRYEIKGLRINLSKTGNVAWFSAILDDYGEWQGQPIDWENVRWTGVLEKKDRGWVIAQMHFSFPTEARSEKKG
jgi:ketosteroid isomerase-like protein